VERGELSHFVKSAKVLLKFTRIRVLFFALSGVVTNNRYLLVPTLLRGDTRGMIPRRRA